MRFIQNVHPTVSEKNDKLVNPIVERSAGGGPVILPIHAAVTIAQPIQNARDPIRLRGRRVPRMYKRMAATQKAPSITRVAGIEFHNASPKCCLPSPGTSCMSGGWLMKSRIQWLTTTAKSIKAAREFRRREKYKRARSAPHMPVISRLWL